MEQNICLDTTEGLYTGLLLVLWQLYYLPMGTQA